ncbi:MAG: GNAT family N-acetyltransferase [Microbacteriaceae bacterium]
MELSTGRSGLVLTELDVGAADEYFELVDRNREHLAPWGYEWEQTATRQDVRDYFADPPAANLSLGLRLEGTLVGRIDLVAVNPPRHSTGYWLDAGHVGHGLMTAAVTTVVAHARSVGATELYAGVTYGNRRSTNVLERTGFELIESTVSHTRWWQALVPGTPAPLMSADLPHPRE